MTFPLFLKKLAVLAAGLFILAFGIALSSKSSIGVSPSASLSYVLSLFLPLSMGTFTMIVNALFVVVQILLLRKNFKLINLLQLVEQSASLEALRIRGLMCVPPDCGHDEVRAYFRKMRSLFERTAAAFPELPIDTLSMGMSHDYDVAVEEGATIVRVGTAIFGARDRK